MKGDKLKAPPVNQKGPGKPGRSLGRNGGESVSRGPCRSRPCALERGGTLSLESRCRSKAAGPSEAEHRGTQA